MKVNLPASVRTPFLSFIHDASHLWASVAPTQQAATQSQLRHKAGKGGSQSARGASKAERATWACQSAKTAAELRAAIESASKVEVSTIDLEHELDQAIERLSKLVAEE